MRAIALLALVLVSVPLTAAPAQSEGDAQAGAQAFNACSARHSLRPGQHMTGPSLADIWEKPAGAVAGFPRYSPALKSSGVVWTFEALNAWLADPRAFIPKTRMTFPGVESEKTRADLIAFLRAVSEGRVNTEPGEMGGGMMGGMMGGGAQDLKTLPPGQQVTAIRYCGDTYDVTTADGEVLQFWEANLRFKTDSSAGGPAAGKPAIMPSGMLGDRASVIFAAPSEFASFIESRC
jgi:cytochrome c